MNTQNTPSWWTQDHTSAWERVKEAMRRDWDQTKRDLALGGGHELNQSVTDTVKQAVGQEPIPPGHLPNPSKASDSWDDVEGPIGYGYGARRTYADHHPTWDDKLESTLERDWTATKGVTPQPWSNVKRWVRHGYEYKGQH